MFIPDTKAAGHGGCPEGRRRSSRHLASLLQRCCLGKKQPAAACQRERLTLFPRGSSFSHASWPLINTPIHRGDHQPFQRFAGLPLLRLFAFFCAFLAARSSESVSIGCLKQTIPPISFLRQYLK
jgi:hypothetical protein